MDELGQALRARIEAGVLPGAVTAVATADGHTRVDTFGVTEFGGEVPMRRETPFRITSMTKPMVATVAMMLVEDGTLALDAPVESWLPELAGRRVLRRLDGELEDTAPAERPILVEDLLTFRLGHGLLLGPESDYPVAAAGRALQLTLAEPFPRTPHPPDEWLRRFASLPLMYQPGARWAYNTGTLLLGVLLSRASGVALDDLLRDRLRTPLGMTSTGFTLVPSTAAELPAHYMAGERPELSPPSIWTQRPPFPDASAGLASTVDDILTFGRFLLSGGGDLLSPSSVAAMTTNHLTQDQIESAGVLLDGSGWGYGMSVTVRPDDISAPGRYGWDGGYGTSWCNDPATGRVFVLLTQVSDILWNGTMPELTRLALHCDMSA
ncbi:serine hydrolase domain-containing protein [Dactylosporangium sp. AC04546]|uniref:serine hydrolase domain-containing protein n=1 Tax=Dactylosporangium sp. AC04546 TaxID=2862460 RepID=UPI001EE1203E|nr:serine hydrolase domain-containing protein [Dactylosporangium sp. AC04546]WVK89163.1 serine hydrolase domain-containing protein [Dactylosporangium sp. AC04546]